jgi:hypothetical protein
VRSTPFFGVDRTTDVTRLAGLRYDATAMNIEEGLIKTIARLCREGGNPDVCFVSFETFSNLEVHLGSRVQYVDIVDESVQVGFRGIRLNGPKGEVKVIPDRSCPSKKAYLIQTSMWVVGSMKAVPHVSDEDGLQSLRVATAAAIEARFACYYNIGCNKPGANAVVLLSA